MNALVKYGLIAAVIAGIYLYNESDTQYTEDDIDLTAVLDVTMDTLYAYQETLDQQDQSQMEPDGAFNGFAEELEKNYNAKQPSLYTTQIGVAPQDDASLYAYEDPNGNQNLDEGENALWKIEIDGENSRVIASSRSGAVNDHHFSGTGLLAGYLLGSMLNRQSTAGVNSKQLANKKPITAQQAARARAGSGSHSRGK